MQTPDWILTDDDYKFIEEIIEIIYYENRTVLIIIVGKRGKGKSLLAIKLAFCLDKAFQDMWNSWDGALKLMKERVVFEPEDFIAVVNNPTLNKGSVIVIDEAGVQVS